MNKKLLLIPLLLCALLLATGCEEETTPTKPEIVYDELTPMATNRLTVFQAESKKNGQLTYSNPDSFKTASDPFVWIGCEWYHDSGNDSIYWRNGVDGLWRLSFMNGGAAWTVEKLYAYPAKPGDKWIVPSDNDTMRLVSYTETVTVDAGTFNNCYRYRAERNDRKRVTTVWFKPGIGKVQGESWEIIGSDTLTSTMKLKYYE